MEPQIQYAKTSDGVNIAYWTLGEGPPLVHMENFPINHVRSEWQDPDRRRWFERLAERRMIVRFDHRGTGLSGGDASTFSLEALTADLEAVVDDRGLERFALFGFINSGPVAIRYAVDHPERLSHLLLWSTLVRHAEIFNLPGDDGMMQLMVKDWVLYTEAYVHQGLGWAEGEAAHRDAALMRNSVSPAVWAAAGAAMYGFDVTDLLPRLKVGTLVLARRQISPSSLGTTAGAYGPISGWPAGQFSAACSCFTMNRDIVPPQVASAVLTLANQLRPGAQTGQCERRPSLEVTRRGVPPRAGARRARRRGARRARPERGRACRPARQGGHRLGSLADLARASPDARRPAQGPGSSPSTPSSMCRASRWSRRCASSAARFDPAAGCCSASTLEPT